MNDDMEREERQLAMASRWLDGYRDRTVALGKLVQLVDALSDEFRLQEAAWVDEFRASWWTLEQVYAVSLDREQPCLSDDLQVMVDEAVDSLRLAVDIALGKLHGTE